MKRNIYQRKYTNIDRKALYLPIGLEEKEFAYIIYIIIIIIKDKRKERKGKGIRKQKTESVVAVSLIKSSMSIILSQMAFLFLEPTAFLDGLDFKKHGPLHFM